MCTRMARFSIGLAAIALAVGRAHAVNPYEVGDPIINPFTGETEIVQDLLGDEMVTTDRDNAIRVASINVGDTFDDPDNPGTTLVVTAVRTNPTTNLTDQITVADSGSPPAVRTIDLVEPVDNSVPPGAEGEPGDDGGEVPVPIPVGNTNVFVKKEEGGNGDGGRDGFGIRICIIECFTIGRSAQVGDDGDAGPAITRTINGPAIESISDDMPGIWVSSTGGDGGPGGDAVIAIGVPAAQGGAAGAGGNVTVTSNVDIATNGTHAYGIFAQSRAGQGGAGGTGYVLNPTAGAGGPAGQGGTVTVTNNGGITTFGEGAIGVFAQSTGGTGGVGGDSYAVVGQAGTASEGGTGGNATAINNGSVDTYGEAAHGVLAESIGGDGGDAGTAAGVITALGGSGNAGGVGGAASVTNNASGSVTTRGDVSIGLFAQSVGGGGGNGGTADSIFRVGGGGGAGSGGAGGSATVTNSGTVTTEGNLAPAIQAQSVGGGGGTGTTNGGLFLSIGGAGGAGGAAGTVTVNNSRDLSTAGNDSHGLFAQSVGGGGGSGGAADSLGIFAGVAIGGSGGDGGSGSTVTVNSCDPSTTTECVPLEVTPLIETAGDRAPGLLAQSVGGGGGSGGGAAQVSVGYVASVSVSVGGSGGGGGNGGEVNVNGETTILTDGVNSEGLFAQSVGGGGGNGGYSVSFAGAAGDVGGAALAIGVGGSGGGGGTGGDVTVNAGGDITTKGRLSEGLEVQSVGGGGGSGGFNVSITAAGAGGPAGALSLGFGGSGGGGGDAGEVDVTYSGDVTTEGDASHAVLIQAVGGGGGSGGFNVSGAVSGAGSGSVSGALGIGGKGGGGGDGGIVDADLTGNIATSGEDSTGLIAQSVGGGGGDGAFNVSGAITGSAGPSGAATLGFGGSGGGGGDGKSVNATLTGNTTTVGTGSEAILVQSAGGGGGSGAFNVSGSVSISSGTSGAVAVGFGGSGGGGGAGDAVTATVTGDVTTSGAEASGITAQSLGGGGGSGAFNVSGSIAGSSAGAATIGVGFGGSGGDGGDAGEVIATVTGNTRTGLDRTDDANDTRGDDAHAILVQSQGGGGGNGAFNVTGGIAVAGSGGGGLSVGFGGSGGGGGDGGSVSATITGDAITTGKRADGVVMQSLGGGGGNGAMNVAGALSLTQSGGGAVTFGVGGSGGDGGSASSVSGTVSGTVSTQGASSVGVLAQTVGGGGGNGALNVSGSVGLSVDTAVGVAIGLGGFGGGGGNSGTVSLTRTGVTTTSGKSSDGVVAQSVGGGGGGGAINVSGALSAAVSGSGTDNAFVGTFGLGGFGGDGGDANNVRARVTGDVLATGLGVDEIVIEDGLSRRLRKEGSSGVVAQSIGGGGGDGALNVSGGIAVALPGDDISGAVNLGVGGFGGGGGDAGTVTLDVDADLVQSVGDRRYGVIAQSVGGGGGNGGINVTGGIVLNGQVNAGVGGFGGDGGVARRVSARADTDIIASGASAIGFVAQSVGGGGGNGHINVSGGIQADSAAKAPSLSFGIGGFGGAGNSSGAVTAIQNGTITVDGTESMGVLAQSVAGGGGNGGLNVSGNIARGTGYAASVGIGGAGGTGAIAGAVTLRSDGAITVDGNHESDPEVELTPEQRELIDYRDRANGILVQSIGGGGGNGGGNVAGILAPSGSPLGVGVGGFGAGGGDAGAVSVFRGENTAALLQTLGNNANGLTAQSIGGGGGNAGFDFVLEGSLNSATGAQQGEFILGGRGGDPGHGQTVDVEHTGDIATDGNHSDAILAQSIGGGGGNAAISVGFGLNKNTLGLNVAVGGAPGDGGNSEKVTVQHEGTITTQGYDSTAIFAQSIGGGGGNAALTLATSIRSAGSFDLGLGRFGGTGGTGGDVDVTSNGSLTTYGDRAAGIRAQSIGNGGGTSGAFSASLTGPTGAEGSGQSSKGNIAVGLEGGAGGTAGRVDVETFGSILTAGKDAHAIHAQSVGGGGGVGGGATNLVFLNTNAVGLGVGGKGGTGGTSGVVDVENHATLTTGGDDAHGIFAQSIGGGGGVGGYAGVLKVITGQAVQEGSFSGTLSIGGTGGTGAQSNTVDVTNTGSITTSGDKAFGVNAESIGGGGGDGGMVINSAFVWGKEPAQVVVQVGGSGNIGGVGSTTTVTNEGTIHTTGKESVGIQARSVGGGGGNAGLVANFDFVNTTPSSNAFTYVHSVGGDGGSGNSAGAVSVTNQLRADGTGGQIITEGDSAHGIFAESLGGGGGNGSSVVSAILSRRSGAESLSASINVGGSGGSGGTGGSVTVTNDAHIETEGAGAHGVFARSLGGGGGSGGLVLATNAMVMAPQTTGLILLGGAGGDGNDAGAVIVNNNGSIVTHGDDSDGVVARSIGGGGGDAGIGLGMTNNVATTVVGLLSNLLGGRGGDGASGGTVTVNHSGDITVLGDGSHAVTAESLNGGGGHIALDFNGITSLPGGTGLPGAPEGFETDPVFVFDAGGTDVQSSNAGLVTLNYTGTFGAAGDNGAANNMQAIGGGGGTFDVNLAILDNTTADADLMRVQSRLGGVNGRSNDGGDIKSAHAGDLMTLGTNTPGLLAQSIGGGGGRANLSVTSETGRLGASEFALGGENGTDERGGTIAHAQNGSIATDGIASHGALLQSIGGGGGLMSFMLSETAPATAVASAAGSPKMSAPLQQAHEAPLSLTLGSAGGTGLDGANVDLQLSGDVSTAGDHAAGMIIQSIGAGGGTANVLGASALEVTIGGSAGASGSGGDIDVTNTGSVSTTGSRAHGVFLQAIGGGGSAVFTDVAAASVSTSSANAGDGGEITFTQVGDIVTTGTNTRGLLVQSLGGGGGFVDGMFAASAGGAGAGGAISLTVDGDLATLGDGSIALFAQSAGGNGGGDISALLTEGRHVVGGANGVGVAFDGGASNLFENRGSVMTMAGISGLAFSGGAGNDAIVNRGTVVGNVDLGDGANSFANNSGATFYSGSTLDLGAVDNLFANDGVLAPGAADLAMATQLSGSFRQSAGATSRFELDFAANTIDSIHATGSMELDGTVEVSLLNAQAVAPGDYTKVLYSGAGGVSDNGLTLSTRPSVVITYDLAHSDAMTTALDYSVDFAPGALVGNRNEIGSYINRVQEAGSTAAMGDTINALVLAGDIETYSNLLTQLGPEFYAEQQAYTLDSVQRFSRAMQDCGTANLGRVLSENAGCTWARFDVQPSSRDLEQGFPDAEQDLRHFSYGFQFTRPSGWTLGAGVAFDNNELSGFGGNWNGDATVVELAFLTRRSFGRTSMGFVVDLGYSDQKFHRRLAVTDDEVTSGDRDVAFLSGVFDVTHAFDVAGLAVIPGLSLGVTTLSSEAMTESGADAQDVVLDGSKETHAWVEPTLGFAYEGSFADRKRLRAYARLGVLQYLKDATTEVHASLKGAVPGVAPMRISSDLDRTHVLAEGGLELIVSDRFTLGLSYAMQSSDTREASSAAARIVFPIN